MNPYIKSLEFTDIMSDSEEKTPTISPDQGATGETATSSKTKEARAQFGREVECAVILYIDKHKGEHYCLSCMGRRDKP